jgi:hypothetical protein
MSAGVIMISTKSHSMEKVIVAKVVQAYATMSMNAMI